MRVSSKLSNVQLELLKLFSLDVSDKDLREIKKRIASYFAEKASKAADKVWEEKGWTQKDVDHMLHTHTRTPYKKAKR